MSSLASIIFGDSPQAAEAVVAGLRDAQGRAVPLGVVKVHNSFKTLGVLRAAWGDKTTYIMRLTPTEHIIDGGMAEGKRPAEIGGEWFNATRPLMDFAPYAYYEVGGPGFHSDDPGRADYYADVIEDAMRRMYQDGYKGVVLCFYEGNPHTLSDGSGIDGWAPYWDVVNLAAQYRYILGMQGYWVNGEMSPSDDWHNFRLLRVFRDYPGKFPPGSRFVKTEAFIDLKTMPPTGWKTALGNDAKRLIEGVAVEDQVWRSATLPPGCEFLGFCGYILQPWGTEWDDFNLWEALPFLLPYIVSQAGIVEVPPEPPLPEGVFPVKVASIHGVNQRAEATSNSTKLGFIAQGAHLLCEYPAKNEYLKAHGQDFHIWERNVTKETIA